MYPQKAEKNVFALLSAPTGATNGETLTATVDTLGYDHVAINLLMSTANVVSNKPSTLKIDESDDNTTFTAITALTGGSAGNTSSNFVIPSADTTNPNILRFNVDTRARKRYLKLTVSPRTTQNVIMDARLSRAEQSPATTTAQGTILTVNA